MSPSSYGTTLSICNRTPPWETTGAFMLVVLGVWDVNVAFHPPLMVGMPVVLPLPIVKTTVGEDTQTGACRHRRRIGNALR